MKWWKALLAVSIMANIVGFVYYEPSRTDYFLLHIIFGYVLLIKS